MTGETAGPLAGVTVLDLSTVLAGPFCGLHLAAMGARVVKIERPDGGDPARRLGADPEMARRQCGLSFLAVNAGKESVALDLKTPLGREIFLELVRRFDVVVENFRPGVMARLGLGHDALAEVNPRLIYCAISGFGQSGPWRDRPAYDQIVQGLSGAMSVTGTGQSAPLRAGFPVADTIGGLTAAFAIAAALVRQRATGRGELIDVSMLEALLGAMGWIVSNNLNGGIEPEPLGNDNFTAAPSGAFRTADKLLNIAANTQEQFVRLCGAIGRPALAQDPRFADGHARKANRAAINAALEAALQARGAAEWEEMLTALGVPAGRVLGVSEALASDQLAGRGFVQPLPIALAGGGQARATRPGFLLSEPFPDPSPPPGLGADTAAWMRRLGYDEEAIAGVTGRIAAPAL